MEISNSLDKISQFNSELQKNQIAKQVKNPFQEIMNSERASEFIFYNPNQVSYEDFIQKVKTQVQNICDIKTL